MTASSALRRAFFAFAANARRAVSGFAALPLAQPPTRRQQTVSPSDVHVETPEPQAFIGRPLLRLRTTLSSAVHVETAGAAGQGEFCLRVNVPSNVPFCACGQLFPRMFTSIQQGPGDGWGARAGVLMNARSCAVGAVDYFQSCLTATCMEASCRPRPAWMPHVCVFGADSVGEDFCDAGSAKAESDRDGACMASRGVTPNSRRKAAMKAEVEV